MELNDKELRSPRLTHKNEHKMNDVYDHDGMMFVGSVESQQSMDSMDSQI